MKAKKELTERSGLKKKEAKVKVKIKEGKKVDSHAFTNNFEAEL